MGVRGYGGCTMKHIQFCTYFFSCGKGGGGGGYKPKSRLKYAVDTRGFGKPVSKQDVTHAEFPELAKEYRVWVRRFSPPARERRLRLAAGWSASAQAPRCCHRPRRGAGDARALRGVFLPVM